MRTNTVSSFLDHLRAADDGCDRDLLAAFAAGDEAAFAALVRRHGPMVLGVCERVLGNRDDAEDAYQSTFLALSRQAARGGWRDSVAGWLHEVAWRSATKLRARDAVRRERERQARPLEGHADACEALDEEIRQLPPKPREAVLACYFEGLTRQQAAQRLGWSLRTLERRLEEGRDGLRQRLQRRGQTPPALLLGPAATLSWLVRARFLLCVLVLAGTVVGVALLPRPAETKPVAAPAVKPEEPLPDGALARLGDTRWRHGFLVYDVKVSADGKTVGSAGGGRGGCIWDAATGRLLQHCNSRRFPTSNALAFSPDAKRVALIESPNINIYDVKTGKILRELKGHTNGVLGTAWSDDGNWIASGSHDTTVRVWNPETGKELHVLKGHTLIPCKVAFSPDSKLLASASIDGTVRVWDPVAGRELHCFTTADTWHEAIAFSADSKLLAWGDNKGDVKLWATDGKSGVRVVANDKSPVRSLAFSPDGKSLAVGRQDGVLRSHAVEDGKENLRWQGHAFAVNSLAFSPDGKTLYSGGVWDSVVRRWDVATGREIDPGRGHGGPIDKLLFAPDNKSLLAFSRDRRAIRWDLETKEARGLRVPDLLGMGSCDFSPDGKRLAVASRVKTVPGVTVRDVETGKPTLTFQHPIGPTAGVAFSNDGRRIVSASENGTLRVWSAEDGKLLMTSEKQPPLGAARSMLLVRFSPDDKLILVGGDEKTIRLHDSATGKIVRERPVGPETEAAVFSPDGETVAIAGGRGQFSITLWSVKTGEVERSWPTSGGISGLAFSRDGRMLAGGGDEIDSTTRVWEVATGQELAVFRGHHSSSWCLAFSRDGRILATGGGDAAVMLWDATGRGGMAGAALTAERKAKLWELLGDDEAKKAHAAAWELALSPGGVEAVRERLKAAKPADVAELVKQLGSDDFATRTSATRQLESLGGAAVPGLRAALLAKPELEVRRRIEGVVARYLRSDERRRESRALAALERAGTPAARKVVAALAAGVKGAPLTEEAHTVQGRMK